MKIARVETHVCNARMRNWVFVKVVTDQDGLYGWGEATLEWHTRAVVGSVQDCAELIIGEDSTRIEHLWQMMYRQHFWHGHGIVRATAIAGIDLALWDILGKVCGVPCSKLWGGPVRNHVRTYCHLGGGRMEDFYETAAEDANRFADLARAVSTPIATGERVTNLADCQRLFAARACEVCQVDITHCGGLSEARRIAALAEAHRIALAPHNPQGPVSTAASLEFGFSQPSYVICESVHGDVPWRQDVVEEGFIIEKAGRIVRPNTRPGLGVSINEAEVKKHPFQQELPQRVFYPDGSVGDW